MWDTKIITHAMLEDSQKKSLEIKFITKCGCIRDP